MKSKRIFQRLLAAVLLPCLLAGCGTSPPPQEAEDQWDPALAHVLGLSQEQRLEDYDYLVETLGSSYLCMASGTERIPMTSRQESFRNTGT